MYDRSEMSDIAVIELETQSSESNSVSRTNGKVEVASIVFNSLKTFWFIQSRCEFI